MSLSRFILVKTIVLTGIAVCVVGCNQTPVPDEVPPMVLENEHITVYERANLKYASTGLLAST